ncbi:MAG: tryptophan synthase subunit alpha [Nitrospira sp.]|nr:tryptophan synthase subunit alpha [Nitrospira sp.]
MMIKTVKMVGRMRGLAQAAHSSGKSALVAQQGSAAPNRLDSVFDRLKAENKKALIIYLMAGDPTLDDTKRLVLALEGAGADIIELGVPFSDPIADGPVIQRAAQRALANGVSLRAILAMVKSLRLRTKIPIVLMLYYNSVCAMGYETFCQAAKDAGVDGVIVPDMPPDEAGPLKGPAEEAGLRLIFLLAPTSTAARRAFVARRSRGFLYYVSLTGITGAKLTDIADVGQKVEKIKKIARAPIAVGFGVATPEDAARVSQFADGVIVGSAVVRRIEECCHAPDMVEQVAEFVTSLKTAMTQK